MIIFGTFRSISPLIKDGDTVLNINSPVEYGERLTSIFPQYIPQGIYLGEYDYDVFLADYILRDEAAFSDLMNIIYSDYLGKRVYIIIDKTWWSMLYIESLIKFIQVRYGFTPNLINEPNDIFFCKETEYSIEGRQLLQTDKERYIYINYDKFMEKEATYE